MKIAIISTFIGQKWAGGEISSFLLAKNLNKKQDVFVVTSKITQRMPFRCYSIPLLKRVPNLVLIIGHKMIDDYMTKKLIKIFKKEKPDVVHIKDFFMMISALKAAKKWGIPTIFTVRSTTFACNLSICLEGNKIPFSYTKKEYKKWLFLTFKQAYNAGWISHFVFPWFYNRNNSLRGWFKKFDYYIAVSDFIKLQAIKAGIDKNKVKTIKVLKGDWEPIPASNKKGIIIFAAGALTKFKGFDFLIKSFKKVVNKYPSTKLRIAGEGSEKSKLIELIKKLRLEKNVTLLGKISYSNMKEEYAKCSFAVSPSIGPECLSRIIFEAFSMKRTVVATDVGGSPEMVKNNKTGLLVKVNDVEETAKAIIKLINNPKLRDTLATNAYNLVNKEANENIVIKRHLSTYQDIIKK